MRAAEGGDLRLNRAAGLGDKENENGIGWRDQLRDGEAKTVAEDCLGVLVFHAVANGQIYKG
jgi:hypothetical protein